MEEMGLIIRGNEKAEGGMWLDRTRKWELGKCAQDGAYEGVEGPLGIIPRARFLDLRAVL
jgi:hypothetical protein